MSLEDNKAVISRFLQEGFSQLNLTLVDEVFASNHVLRTPLTGVGGVSGTEVIKRALEDYHEQGTGARCTVLNQIAEGDWVATSYTLGKEQEEHMGVMFSRLVDRKIQETFVVARDVSESEGSAEEFKKGVEPRQHFN
jgi:hypothetical protein